MAHNGEGQRSGWARVLRASYWLRKVHRAMGSHADFKQGRDVVDVGGSPPEKRSRISPRHSFVRQASVGAAGPLHRTKTEAQVPHKA